VRGVQQQDGDMQNWRRIGMETIPELSEVIRKVRDSMALWIELHLIYEHEATTSSDLGERIMQFAHWCFEQPGVRYSDAVYQSVTCAFIEHVVEDRSNWPLFRKYFSKADVEALRPLWEYNFHEKARDFIIEICAV
jgi:hypothetical protein